MALLDDVKTRIETLTLNGWVVKRSEAPSTPDKVITLFQYAGNAPALGFARPGFQYENPGLQVKVRGVPTDYDGPRVMIETIWRDLVKVQDLTVGSTHFLMITANQQPFLVERDGTQRCVWAVNFICETEVPA